MKMIKLFDTGNQNYAFLNSLEVRMLTPSLIAQPLHYFDLRSCVRGQNIQIGITMDFTMDLCSKYRYIILKKL